MKAAINDQALRQLFTDAHTLHGFTSRPVDDATLQAIRDLAKWGPTSMNCLPMRLVFVKSQAAKEKLRPSPAGGKSGVFDQARSYLMVCPA